MDSLITAAARSLANGHPLSALERVSLREDPPAVALRGMAMAQLGDLAKAKQLLRRAARAFGPREPIARERCPFAEAEIALVLRDTGGSNAHPAHARGGLGRCGDRATRATGAGNT